MTESFQDGKKQILEGCNNDWASLIMRNVFRSLRYYSDPLDDSGFKIPRAS